MTSLLVDKELQTLAPAGHHIALRIGFAFPMVEENHWPSLWVEHYTAHRYVLRDPVMRWAYTHSGAIRWSDIDEPDPDHVMSQARVFGLHYGAVVACHDCSAAGLRSFASFARKDRQFDEDELALLLGHLQALHHEKAPPENLTRAELEALAMLGEGLRQKQIAYMLGVTEGAIKQRLRNAKRKLDAQTGTQAVTMAREYGLV